MAQVIHFLANRVAFGHAASTSAQPPPVGAQSQPEVLQVPCKCAEKTLAYFNADDT